MISWRRCGLAALLLSLSAFLGVASSGLACSGTIAAQEGGVDAPPPPPGAVFLQSLSISLPTTGDAGPPTITPPFAWDIHDYYVPCAAGPNTGTLSMTASKGSDSQLVLPTQSPKKPEQTLPLTVNENDLVVAVATSGSTTVEYWVRCLPHDFPVMQWMPHPEVGTPSPGYYLVGNPYPVHNEAVAWAIVLDSNGVPVWYYKETGALTGVYDVDSLSTGTISFNASPSSLPWEIHQVSQPKVTGVGEGGVLLDNHELRFVAKNGHYFYYNVPIEEGFDLSNLSIPALDGSVHPLGRNENIASSEIVEVDANDDRVWSWDVTAHFDPNTACTYAALGATNWHAADNPRPVFDVFHLNSIDLDLGSDGLPRGLLLSARNMDSVFYVDYASKNVVWKMGGTRSSKDKGVNYLPALSDPFFRQHDARLLPGWSSTTCGGRGRISVFDDETATGQPARGAIYDVTVASDGTASCATPGATLTWQYEGLEALFMGSFRVQPDGSGLIGWGVPVRGPGPVFSEVDVHQHDMLDLNFMPGNSYRAIKVPVEALDLAAMRKSAGVAVPGF